MRPRRKSSACPNLPLDDPEDPKAFVERQELLRPYRIGQPIHECLGPDLEYLGFGAVTFYRAEPHAVFAYRGRIGSSGCTTADQLRKTIKRIAHQRGVTISIADVLATVSRHRFEAVLSLPVEGPLAVDELPEPIDEGDFEM